MTDRTPPGAGAPDEETRPRGRGRGVWVLTPGRLIVLYVAATLFGVAISFLVRGAESMAAVVGAAMGAAAMSLVTLVVLTVSYRRPGAGERRSESSGQG